MRHAAREYSIQRDLDHARVVKLWDVFEVDADTFATVLEHCSGGDLDLLLREKTTLKEGDAKALLLQILAGLKYLQTPAGSGDAKRRGIIHYDLKPGNILFDARGPGVAAPSRSVVGPPADGGAPSPGRGVVAPLISFRG